MQRLSAAILRQTQVPHGPAAKRPERVLQFGEGAFLRAFVDQMIDAGNAAGAFNGSVVVVQPIERGQTHLLDAQDGLYTLVLRGKQGGRVVRDTRIITSISRTVNPYADYEAFLACAKNPDLRFIVSNTTEAGIVYTGADGFDDAPQASFPGKLTRFLYERYLAYGTEPGMGFVLLPCELIDRNGDELLACVCKTAEQWKLGGAFADWVRTGNVFTNTLVDRITTGYPKEDAAALQAALGYEDALLNTAEPFGLWVVQGPAGVAAEFPLDKAGQPLLFTDNAAPYKLRKVRMLNGAHTCTVLGAYLAGLNTVGECMADADIRAYLERALHQEIMPVLSLPQQELQVFADAVIERFENPFNRHYLLNIALNSVSKFRARVLPTLQDYRRKKGTLPPVLTFSLAALLAFYRGKPTPDGFCGQRGGDAYAIVDDQPVLDFFAAHGEDALDTLADAALARVDFWGEDLRGVPGLAQAVTEGLRQIEEKGAKAAMTAVSRSQPA